MVNAKRGIFQSRTDEFFISSARVLHLSEEQSAICHSYSQRAACKMKRSKYRKMYFVPGSNCRRHIHRPQTFSLSAEPRCVCVCKISKARKGFDFIVTRARSLRAGAEKCHFYCIPLLYCERGGVSLPAAYSDAISLSGII
jgi:hypothetical protein